MILLLSKPVRNTIKRAHPINTQLAIIELAPGNTERFIPQYYIYKNMAIMTGMRV